MSDLPRLPFEQPTLLDLPPCVRQLLAQQPISRVRTQAGDEAWYVTRYVQVKQLLTDPRLGRSHPDPEHAPRFSNSILFGGPLEPFETEQEQHAQMRALLTPFFSAKRMDALRPRIEFLADQLIDALASSAPPVDLHASLSFAFPVLVICELLGVPSEDRDQFHAWSVDLADLHDQERARAALGKLVSYMAELVPQKRAHPVDDVLSGLCQAHGGMISDEQVAFLGAMLLFAGHETTVVRIDMGALLFLTHPSAQRQLLEKPELIVSAVEEVLRASNTGSDGLPRYARTDLDIDGISIKAGEAVLLSTSAANFDSSEFEAPDGFDIARSSNQHLTFGYGSRFCIGAPLARIELQTIFARLFRRLLNMQLVQPLEELHARDVLTGGLEELWVTW
jgi:pentalenolactone synthase